eukprot:scaffold1122_cov377-Prasinococcus_capsulatus_cf.AAC.4
MAAHVYVDALEVVGRQASSVGKALTNVRARVLETSALVAPVDPLGGARDQSTGQAAHAQQQRAQEQDEAEAVALETAHSRSPQQTGQQKGRPLAGMHRRARPGFAVALVLGLPVGAQAGDADGAARMPRRRRAKHRHPQRGARGRLGMRAVSPLASSSASVVELGGSCRKPSPS